MVERSAVDGFAAHAFPVIFIAVFILSLLAGIGAWRLESTLLMSAAVITTLVLTAYLLLAWRQSQSLNQISAVLDQDGSRYRDIALGQELNAGAIRHLKHYALESERSHKHQHERLAEFLHMASELATSAEHSALNADHQKQAIACSAAAVTELSQSIRDVASQVNDAHQRIESSRQETSESMHIAKSTREDIHGTTQLADQTAQLVSELSVQSNNVVTMSTIIQDIADQTNLLSLNAAIEAARAGEQGMGFAVVADEVRKLSHRSRDSAEEISTSIAQVQKQMSLIKEQVDDVVEKAHLNVGSINAMEERLSSADASMASLTEKMYVISTAAEQQSLATDEISRNIEAILSQAEQNSAISSETVSISKYLAEKAQQSQKEAVVL